MRSLFISVTPTWWQTIVPGATPPRYTTILAPPLTTQWQSGPPPPLQQHVVPEKGLGVFKENGKKGDFVSHFVYYHSALFDANAFHFDTLILA